jgi:hypothetical protein
MKLRILYIIILLTGIKAEAQVISPWKYDPSAKDVNLWRLRRYEFSVGGGVAQIFGDIGGFTPGKNLLGLKDLAFRQTRINVNPSLKYKINESITARAGLAMGYFHSVDTRGSNVNRGYESVTLFFEPSLIGEYHLLVPTIRSYSGTRKRLISERSILSKLDVYFFTGLGMVTYNVLPNDLLEPKMTKKAGAAAVIPLGAGVNLMYSRYFNFGVELGGRYAFTDNLDGYSSSFSKSNDVYYLMNFVLTYKIRTGSNGLPFFK